MSKGARRPRELTRLVSGSAAFELQRRVIEQSGADRARRETRWVLASDAVDLLLKGHVDRALPEAERPLSDQQLALGRRAARRGLAARSSSTSGFLTGGDSREPEQRRHLGRGGRIVLHAGR